MLDGLNFLAAVWGGSFWIRKLIRVGNKIDEGKY